MFRRKRSRKTNDVIDINAHSSVNKIPKSNEKVVEDVGNHDRISMIEKGPKEVSYIDRTPVDTISDGWPIQTLLHGSVFRVAWNGGGDDYENIAEDIDASVGITQEEAIAAMISGELFQDGHIDESSVRSIETFLVGFAHGLLGQMDEPDGIHRFNNALHRETFDSISSGIIFDYAKEEMDILERRKSSPYEMLSNHVSEKIGAYSLDEVYTESPLTEFTKDPLSEFTTDPVELHLMEMNKLPTSEQQGTTLPSEPSPSTPSAVEYSAPRYYEAKDPILMLTNSRRSTRHGGDGIFEDDGRMVCRSTRGLIGWAIVYDGEDETKLESWDRSLLVLPLHRSVPIQCRELIWEFEKFSQSLEHESYRNQFDLFSTGDSASEWRNGWQSDFLPSPVSLNLWKHQAWVPIIADLRIQFTPNSSGWSMGNYDFELNPSSSTSGQTPFEFERRIPVSHSTGRLLADRLRRFLEEESILDENGEDGVINSDEAGAIQIMIDEYLHRDLLTISLSSIDEAIDEISADLALRSGSLEIKALSIIDAFGQVVEFQTTGGFMDGVRVGLSLETPDDSNNILLMKPRIPRGARLNLRLLSYDEDQAEANSGSSILALDPDDDMIPPARSPVCGFLLPDHIEWAMEVFDHNGEAKGQLRVGDRHWGHLGIQKGQLAWDIAPGLPSPVGELPDSGNIHLDRLLHSMIDIGLVDDIERGKWDDLDENADGELDEDEMGDFSGENTGEGVLSAILRAIDTTNWHSDPYGKGGDDYPAFYMGRPVAVVRAVLRLEVSQTTPMPENLRKHAFEVRLGAIENRLDGLLGYFVNDDYTRFNTVYPIQNGAPVHPETSIDHEFLDFDPTLEIRPEEDIYLTLLMNPQSAVHVTSGILPQKEIVLLREHWQDAVAKIAPTFKVGPVLVDPTSVRMPVDDMKPNLIWKWTHRETPSEWIEGPIKRSDSLAGLPHGKMTAYEGWIKLDIDENQDSGN